MVTIWSVFIFNKQLFQNIFSLIILIMEMRFQYVLEVKMWSAHLSFSLLFSFENFPFIHPIPPSVSLNCCIFSSLTLWPARPSFCTCPLSILPSSLFVQLTVDPSFHLLCYSTVTVMHLYSCCCSFNVSPLDSHFSPSPLLSL